MSKNSPKKCTSQILRDISFAKHSQIKLSWMKSSRFLAFLLDE